MSPRQDESPVTIMIHRPLWVVSRSTIRMMWMLVLMVSASPVLGWTPVSSLHPTFASQPRVTPISRSRTRTRFANTRILHPHDPHHGSHQLSLAPRPASTTTDDRDTPEADDPVVWDVVVCGAGPAGLLLAQELSRRQLRVVVVDPALDQPWPNNYGVWMDEADHFHYRDCVDRVWTEVGIVFDETTPEVVLRRPYGRIDRKRMKARLMETCRAHGVEFATRRATKVEHFATQPSLVTTISKDEPDPILYQTLLVADATGFSRQFVEHDVEFDPGYQVTYGARFRVKDLGPYQLDRMVLMDYSEQHLYEDPVLTKSNIRFPSFVYAMPLAHNELFLEETVLVSRPGCPSKDLQARLKLRMKALGIEALEVLEDERAAIPMGGMDPVVPQRTLGFGATASLIHPASGYMLARAMEIAPRVADAVATALKHEKQQQEKTDDQKIIIQPGQLDRIAEAGWNAVWPTDERRQRDFMHFGFELLCRLNPQELRDFFIGFFRLPNALWEHFLSWRLSGVGHIVMGVTVWATCIPKRFMASMLRNSLPFISNRLVRPFTSRGNFAPIDTSSVYTDAYQGNATNWEPDSYYPYIEQLTKQGSTGIGGSDGSGETSTGDNDESSELPAPKELDLVK